MYWPSANNISSSLRIACADLYGFRYFLTKRAKCISSGIYLNYCRTVDSLRITLLAKFMEELKSVSSIFYIGIVLRKYLEICDVMTIS